MKIAISAGHSKYVRGMVGPSPWGIEEVDEARRVTARVGELLNAGGVPTKTYWDDVSKTQDENLARICDWHNAQSRDHDVSVHFNSADPPGHGAEVFYQSAHDLAKTIVDKICAASGLTNRGPKTGNLYFLSHTAKPAVLVEVCFGNHKGDCETYRRAFEPICLAIAEGLAGQKLGAGPTPPEPPEEERPPWLPGIEPPAIDARRTIAKGDNGPDVAELQRGLGVLTVDADYGPTTETWVKAFQGSCGLSRDGVCGPQTWAQVDLLTARLRDGEPPLPKALADQIYTMAQTSEIAEFSWPGRGIPPPGFVPGMALCFAVALRRAEAGDPAGKVMSKELGNTDKDALTWYKTEFTSKGMKLGTWDERLRALFTLMIGLGPRESSGRYFEGRDLSASNVESDTAEAGTWQTSWNCRSASSAIPPLLPEFMKNPNGFLEVFREGLAPTSQNLDSYGSGDGLRYQWLSRFCPLFHAMVTGCCLRVLRQHHGPVNRKEVTINKDADNLLKDVQALIESVA